MYELLVSLRGKDSSVVPYVGLREWQSLADVHWNYNYVCPRGAHFTLLMGGESRGHLGQRWILGGTSSSISWFLGRIQINEGPNLLSCPLSALFAGYFTLTITFHKQRSWLHLKERAGVRSRHRRWTQWSLWDPYSSGHSLILWEAR